MQTSSFILAAALFISGATADAAPLEDTVKADLATQASRAYALILADGVAAGRLYSRPATVSGTKRHVEEFVARHYLPRPKVSSAE